MRGMRRMGRQIPENAKTVKANTVFGFLLAYLAALAVQFVRLPRSHGVAIHLTNYFTATSGLGINSTAPQVLGRSWVITSLGADQK